LFLKESRFSEKKEEVILDQLLVTITMFLCSWNI